MLNVSGSYQNCQKMAVSNQLTDGGKGGGGMLGLTVNLFSVALADKSGIGASGLCDGGGE
jgi:hypothetical protein